MPNRRRALTLGLSAAGAAALGAAAGAGWWLTRRPAPPPREGSVSEFQLADIPERVEGLTFRNADGQALSLDDFRGRVVLLNLWATWCAPCVREMPDLDQLQADMGGDAFQVIALSQDREGLEVVRPFYQEHDLADLPIYLDPEGQAMRVLSPFGLPTTYLFDARGRRRGHLGGVAKWDSPEAKALIRHYLPA